MSILGITVNTLFLSAILRTHFSLSALEVIEIEAAVEMGAEVCWWCPLALALAALAALAPLPLALSALAFLLLLALALAWRLAAVVVAWLAVGTKGKVRKEGVGPLKLVTLSRVAKPAPPLGSKASILSEQIQSSKYDRARCSQELIDRGIEQNNHATANPGLVKVEGVDSGTLHLDCSGTGIEQNQTHDQIQEYF